MISPAIHGVVLLDKPAGITSQTAVTIVKRIFGAQKAGHTGTLDPMASGLLPVCLGEATKYSQDLLDADKTYLAEIRWGQSTNTGDAEGEIVAQAHPDFDIEDADLLRERLCALQTRFLGTIEQVPPMYSALKKDGKPLYEYARAGQEIERVARTVEIHSLDWLAMAWPKASLRVACSKGTYIRTLAEDMGHALGCGAHLSALRREAVGHLQLDRAHTLEELRAMDADRLNRVLLPVDALVQNLSSLGLGQSQAERFCLGQRVPVVSNTDQSTGHAVRTSDEEEQVLRIYRGSIASDNFLGTANFRKGVLHPKRLMAQVAA